MHSSSNRSCNTIKNAVSVKFFLHYSIATCFWNTDDSLIFRFSLRILPNEAFREPFHFQEACQALKNIWKSIMINISYINSHRKLLVCPKCFSAQWRYRLHYSVIVIIFMKIITYINIWISKLKSETAS
jgi:hypothetical protein